MTDETAELSGADDNSVEEQAKPSPFKRKGTRRILLGAAIILVVLGGIWFFNYWTVGRFMESTDDSFVQADSVIVAPKIAGYVQEVFVQDNEAVDEGDPLLRIDPGDYRSDVEAAQAQIDIASANAQALRAQIAEQEAAVSGARAQLTSARADLKLAQTIEERYKALSATGAESRETYGEKRRQLTNAQAAVALRESELTSAQRRIQTLRAQIGEAQAQAEGGEAQRQSASSNLSSTLLRASISGRIGNKTVQTGQFVQPGTRLMSIVPMSQLYVVANFKETQVGLMRVGQPVTIDVDALGGIELHGKVASFAPGTGAQFSLLPPENATGNFTKIVQRIPVRISIDASAQAREMLVPGMSASVTVDTRSARGSMDQIEAQQAAHKGA